MSIWPMYNLEFKKKYAISCSNIYIPVLIYIYLEE